MRALLWLAVWSIGCVAARDAAAQPECRYPYRVGYSAQTIAGMRVALWYPTVAEPSNYTYPGAMEGFVAYGAAPSCARVPLVVFSHGLGGCGTQSIYFTEELARHGYVVAAPDHNDTAFCTIDGGPGDPLNLIPQAPLNDPSKWSDATYADRRDDMEALIDTLVADPVFGAMIDANAIGAAGHSLGGYTVVGLAGGWASWKDYRVKAVLGLSPHVLPYLYYVTLPTLAVPVMYQGGDLDVGVTPFLEGPNGAYAVTPPPKYFPKLNDATHFAWTNSACGSAPTVRECLGQIDPWLVDAYAIAFFDRYLKARRSSLLDGGGTGLEEYYLHSP
jgi:predicted dienelactone hydrolase